MDGSNWDYTNWCEGEPNNVGYIENCVYMRATATSKWNDISCHDTSIDGFICQKKKLDDVNNFNTAIDTDTHGSYEEFYQSFEWDKLRINIPEEYDLNTLTDSDAGDEEFYKNFEWDKLRINIPEEYDQNTLTDTDASDEEYSTWVW